jgi:AraC family transcriptional regulator
MATITFPFGGFYGDAQKSLSIPSFVLSLLDQTKPERQVLQHTHDEAHFVLVIRGGYTSAAREIYGPCGPSALIYNPPATTHRDRFLGDSGGKFFTISVAPQALAALDDSPSLHAVSIGYQRGHTQWLSHQIYLEFKDQFSDSAAVLQTLALELLDRAAHKVLEPPSSPPLWLARARQVLQDRFREDILIGEIAEEVGVHPLHLIRTFRRFYGTSAGEYLRYLRVLRTAEMLSKTQLSIIDISSATGFSDQSHLTRVFKQITGITPAAYRRLFN